MDEYQSLEFRLSNLLNKKTSGESSQSVQPQCNPLLNPVIPPPIITTCTVSDSFKAMLEALRDVKLTPEPKQIWKDDELQNLKCIRLRGMEHSEIVYMGEQMLTSIQTAISARTIEMILQLSYNIMNGQGTRLTADVPVGMEDVDDFRHIDELHDKILWSGGSGKRFTYLTLPGKAEEKYKRLACAYTYIACSYLRLFTKSADNYTKIGDRLMYRFSNFYNFDMPIKGFHPDSEAVRCIKSQFEWKGRYKNTLYIFLSTSASNTDGRNMKDFLYDSHLSYTGLHPFALYTKVMDVTRLDGVKLAELLAPKKFYNELDGIWAVGDCGFDNGKLPELNFREIYSVLGGIRTVLGNYYPSKPEFEKKMWKYARIFDSNFLSNLQTKKCVFFTCVLANILNTLDPVNFRDILNIAQIADAGERDKRLAMEYAMRVIKAFRQ